MRGLEFNPSVSNLLASGAGESDVFITDLTNPGSPSVYSPGAKSNGPPSDISSVAWNRKVQHILASTSHSGLSVVWDLKLKKPVISFQDPNNKTQRNSVITWNPEAATEVLVASADDRSPVLQIWDLRNATMPARTAAPPHHRTREAPRLKQQPRALTPTTSPQPPAPSPEP